MRLAPQKNVGIANGFLVFFLGAPPILGWSKNCIPRACGKPKLNGYKVGTWGDRYKRNYGAPKINGFHRGYITFPKTGRGPPYRYLKSSINSSSWSLTKTYGANPKVTQILVGGWNNQPIWKICNRQIGSFLQGIGMNINKYLRNATICRNPPKPANRRPGEMKRWVPSNSLSGFARSS